MVGGPATTTGEATGIILDEVVKSRGGGGGCWGETSLSQSCCALPPPLHVFHLFHVLLFQTTAVEESKFKIRKHHKGFPAFTVLSRSNRNPEGHNLQLFAGLCPNIGGKMDFYGYGNQQKMGPVSTKIARWSGKSAADHIFFKHNNALEYLLIIHVFT